MVTAAACTLGVGEEQVVELSGFDAPARLEAELLASRLRCAACHAAPDATRIEPVDAPVLDGIGARKTPAGLRKWLSDPHGAKPGTAMPDLLAALPQREREGVLEALVHYLAAQGGPLEPGEELVDLPTLEEGRRLYHSVGCVACHEPQESLEDLDSATWEFDADQALAPAVAADLGAPAFDTSVDALAKFLVDPLAARPSGRMPALHLSEREARAIATYLLRGQCDSETMAWAPGWEAQYFEYEGEWPDLRDLEPVRKEVVRDIAELPDGHREDYFAYRFRGFVEVPQSGEVEFTTRSDDGARLWVDDKLLIDEWHDQAPADHSGALWLERGRHALEVWCFEIQGGEEFSLDWKLPGGARVTLPAEAVVHAGLRMKPPQDDFTLDARKVERGRAEFARLGCGACHVIEGREPRVAPLRPPALDELRARSEQGCLSAVPRARTPHFDLDDAQVLALRTLLLEPSSLSTPREPADEAHAQLSQLNCYACHRRGEQGGPELERAGYFRPAREVDLGDEGRLPPHLDGVGAKLKLAALERVLETGRGVRPYLATRMPQFGARNVHGLAQLLASVDGEPADALAPPFEAAHIELGRKLAGSKGLGCIQCHSFNGVESLGIPAVDLGVVAERLQPRWFQRLLLDPRSVGMNSRMAILWQESSDGRLLSPVTDLCGGEPRAQIDALWSYLSLGASMPIPEGLDTPDSDYELIPTDEPLMCAVFLEDSSPRGMMVGFPQGVHYAFDVEHSRLAWMWRGRFFNAKGTWRARAGALERPPTADAYRFSGGLPFAFDAPRGVDEWPTMSRDEARYRRLGWRFDSARVPIWRYAFGEVEIEERITPRVDAARVVLVREFTLRAPREVDNLYFDILERRRVSGWVREGDAFVARFTQEAQL